MKCLKAETLKETLLRTISRTPTMCTRQRNLSLTTVLADTTLTSVIEEERELGAIVQNGDKIKRNRRKISGGLLGYWWRRRFKDKERRTEL